MSQSGAACKTITTGYFEFMGMQFEVWYEDNRTRGMAQCNIEPDEDEGSFVLYVNTSHPDYIMYNESNLVWLYFERLIMAHLNIIQSSAPVGLAEKTLEKISLSENAGMAQAIPA